MEPKREAIQTSFRMLEEGRFSIYELCGLFAPVCQHIPRQKRRNGMFHGCDRPERDKRDERKRPAAGEILNAVAQASLTTIYAHYFLVFRF